METPWCFKSESASKVEKLLEKFSIILNVYRVLWMVCRTLPHLTVVKVKTVKKIQFSLCKIRRVMCNISAKSFYLNVKEKSAVPVGQSTNAK